MARNYGGPIISVGSYQVPLQQVLSDPASRNTLFRVLDESMGDKYRAVLACMLRNADDAADAMQEVYIKVHKNLHQFDGRAALTTWVYKIVVRQGLDALRRRKSDKCHLHDSLDDLSGNGDRPNRVPEPSDPLTSRLEEQVSNRDYCEALLGGATEEQRRLLMLKDAEQYSVDDLVAMTGLGENTIKVKLFRARQRLVGYAKRLKHHGCHPVTRFPLIYSNGSHPDYAPGEAEPAAPASPLAIATRVEPELEAAMPPQAPPPATPSDTPPPSCDSLRTYQILAELPRGERLSVFFHDCLEVPKADAARIQGVRQSTFGSYLSRGRSRIDRIQAGSAPLTCSRDEVAMVRRELEWIIAE